MRWYVWVSNGELTSIGPGLRAEFSESGGHHEMGNGEEG